MICGWSVCAAGQGRSYVEGGLGRVSGGRGWMGGRGGGAARCGWGIRGGGARMCLGCDGVGCFLRGGFGSRLGFRDN